MGSLAQDYFAEVEEGRLLDEVVLGALMPWPPACPASQRHSTRPREAIYVDRER